MRLVTFGTVIPTQTKIVSKESTQRDLSFELYTKFI